MSFGAKSREKVQHKVKWVVLYNNGRAKIPNNGHAKLPNHSEHSCNLREFGLNFKQTSLFKTNNKPQLFNDKTLSIGYLH